MAAALLAAGALVPPAWLTAGPPLCPFRLLTGLPCPGCGMTRSVVSALHGDLAAAVYYHPVGPFVVAALVAVALPQVLPASALAVSAVRLRGLMDSLAVRSAQRPIGSLILTQRILPWLTLGAVLLVWLLRLPLFALGYWVY